MNLEFSRILKYSLHLFPVALIDHIQYIRLYNTYLGFSKVINPTYLYKLHSVILIIIITHLIW